MRGRLGRQGAAFVQSVAKKIAVEIAVVQSQLLNELEVPALSRECVLLLLAHHVHERPQPNQAHPVDGAGGGQVVVCTAFKLRETTTVSQSLQFCRNKHE